MMRFSLGPERRITQPTERYPTVFTELSETIYQ